MKVRAWWLVLIPFFSVWLANKIGPQQQKFDELGDPIVVEQAHK